MALPDGYRSVCEHAVQAENNTLPPLRWFLHRSAEVVDIFNKFYPDNPMTFLGALDNHLNCCWCLEQVIDRIAIYVADDACNTWEECGRTTLFDRVETIIGRFDSLAEVYRVARIKCAIRRLFRRERLQNNVKDFSSANLALRDVEELCQDIDWNDPEPPIDYDNFEIEAPNLPKHHNEPMGLCRFMTLEAAGVIRQWNRNVGETVDHKLNPTYEPASHMPHIYKNYEPAKDTITQDVGIQSSNEPSTDESVAIDSNEGVAVHVAVRAHPSDSGLGRDMVLPDREFRRQGDVDLPEDVQARAPALKKGATEITYVPP